MEDVRPLDGHHRPEADDQGAPRQAAEVVLKEKFYSLVENQQLRKKKNRLATATSPAIIPKKFIVMPSGESFFFGCERMRKKIMLHSNCCKQEKSVEGREG